MAEFVHLHNHSDYSLLDGAASVGSMVARAKALGMGALALTDHGNMFGAVKFYDACREAGVKPIVGSEFYVAGGSRHERTGTENGNKYWHLILLARDEKGYRNLLKLSSISYTEGFYYKPRIDFEVLSAHAQGLVCSSACIAGEIPGLVLMGKEAEAERVALRYAELFGKDGFFLELQDHGIEEQKTANRALVRMSARTGIPLICTNDMHYLERADAEAHDVLLCIGTNRKRSDLERMRFNGSEFYMKSPDEMAALFAEVPEALSNTLRVAEMVDLQIAYPGPLLPEYEVPSGFSSPDEYLRHLTYEGLKERYPSGGDEIRSRADYELGVIIKMGFTGYFLIVWDFIDWAKQHGIPVGPGRGSGAGSIVAYSLRITDIDPLKYNLLFERFLNPERISMPDFDVDFCFERRGEVIDYVTRKYGADRTGQIITFGTLKAKAVIKDVARVLDVPFEEANNIAKLVPEDPKMTLAKAFEDEPKLKAMADDVKYRDLFAIARKLENKNRHNSFHAAGIVIGKTALTDFVPLYRDPKTGIVSTQFTMDYLEKCGLVKMDFLGLKTLTLIKHTIDLIRKRGIHIEESEIPEDDRKTFELLGEGKSTSVFQFESSGMQGILKQAKPTSIEDLIALNALYRPGPMDYIPQYIDSKMGRTPITYPHPSLEKYLKETYGVIVYQEQVMQVAQEVAGYSLGRADLLRRAMGKKKKDVLEKEEAPFIEGAVKRGYSKEKAKEIFEILVPFAGYGFNKSHAAAYSVVAYRTAYFKANYPAEFMAANLTNEIANTDKLTEYIGEARAMGIEVLPPDINRSEAYFTVADGKVVYGLLGIKGVGEGLATAIAAEREKGGKFSSFIEFLERLGTQAMNKKTLECLASAGCFDSLGHSRRELVLEIERAVAYVQGKEESSRFGQASLFDGSGEEEYPPFEVARADEYPRADILRIEKELLGFYFTGHPMDEWKDLWSRCCDADLAHPERSSPERTYTLVAMLKEFREILTKTGKKMAFGALEDPNGSIECVVFSDALERWRDKLAVDAVVFARGKIDLSRGNPSFKVDELVDPASLKEKSWREVHLRLGRAPDSEDELYPLRDAIFDEPGPCGVYFHVPPRRRGAAESGRSAEADGETAPPEPEGAGGTAGAADADDETVIKAHVQITCSASEEALERLRSVSPVIEAWRD
jgi:DNA polymerase III subunit alpha